MPKNIPTEHASRLISALKSKGLQVKEEYWDGHKHVDIYIPQAKLYIEVDGVPHYTKPEQLISDFERDYYSFKEGFFTKHITNEAIDTHCEQIAVAIAKVVRDGAIQRSKFLE